MNTTSTQQPGNSSATTDQEAGVSSRPRPLYRPLDDRMLAGVASGIADYLGVDETLVRIGIVVATFFGGAGIAVYLAGWLLIPEEGSDQSIASELLQSVSARSR